MKNHDLLIRNIRHLSILFVILFSTQAFAEAKVAMEVIAEKDVVEVNKKGKEVKKRLLAEQTIPGDVLFMTIKYKNSGDESAKNVKIDNPIPAGTIFQANSAWGDNVEIQYSIDGGKTFKKPTELTYQVENSKGEKEKKKANPEQYNAVRWVVNEIPAGGKGNVGFSVMVQ